MALLTGRTQIFSGDTSIVDTAQKHPLGTRAMDPDGNEYIYMQGVASCVAGDWVFFDENHVTTRTVANAQGRIAIAMAAIAATTSFGWFQVYGKNTIALVLSGFVDDGKIYLTSTAGSVDDSDVSGDFVVGAIGRSAVSGGVATVELNYPIVQDTAFD